MRNIKIFLFLLVFRAFTNTFVVAVKRKTMPPMWVNKDNNKLNHIVPQLNWAITLVVIVVVIISHQYGG